MQQSSLLGLQKINNKIESAGFHLLCGTGCDGRVTHSDIVEDMPANPCGEWPAWLFRAGDLPPTRVARFPGEIGELLGDAMSARSNFIDIWHDQTCWHVDPSQNVCSGCWILLDAYIVLSLSKVNPGHGLPQPRQQNTDFCWSKHPLPVIQQAKNGNESPQEF